ncbi:MAG: response regulator transcription factor [Bacteroidota bacterium]|nr:response regulator transcription factor [Bacteroidota bacterium]
MIRIVIYDDSPQRSESLSVLLSLTDNMECVADFPDCRHVFDDMTSYNPDVVLMDIEMPGVDGISGVSIIKKHFPHIRIIMQTIFQDEERIFASLKAGAEGYILKTATVENILRSIEDVYSGGAYMTPSVALRVMNYFGRPVRNDQSYNLSGREKEVLKFLTDGLSYKMIADKMGVTYFTINAHVKKIYEKLHVHSLGEAVALALKKNVI